MFRLSHKIVNLFFLVFLDSASTVTSTLPGEHSATAAHKKLVERKLTIKDE